MPSLRIAWEIYRESDVYARTFIGSSSLLTMTPNHG